MNNRSSNSNRKTVNAITYSLALISGLLGLSSYQTANAQPSNEAEECSNGISQEPCNKDLEQTLIITQRKIPMAGLEPTTQSSSNIELADEISVPTTLTDLVVNAPGVAENGQPGLFQVISIRGVSRQRILTLVDGVKLHGDRRAGVAASFIDPLFLESVDVVRGPISSYYGSGAIGGTTDLHFSKTNGIETAFGYQNSGHQNYQSISLGNESTSVSIVHRKANNSRDVINNQLNTHFEQTAGYLQTNWAKGDYEVSHWLFSSKGSNLGRSNSRFPERVINIPAESHTLLKTSLTNQNLWSLDFSIHDQSTTTQTIRPGDKITDVKGSSIDWSSNWQTAWEYSDESIMLGLDYDRRQQVNLKERQLNLVNNQVSNTNTLVDGTLDEVAMFYAHHKQSGQFRFQFGGRYTFVQSGQYQEQTISDSAATGFAGMAYSVSDNFELNTNIGNSFRFPSLTERFFSGTTARGFIQGNPNLEPEKATTLDFGLNWHSLKQNLTANLFATHFSSYIERVQVSDEQLTYVNQQEGVIKGLELEYKNDLTRQINAKLTATIIDGKNDNNQPISDIPSDRVQLSLAYHRGDYLTQCRLQHRFGKTDTGNGELATGSANIARLSVTYITSHNWKISVYANNLFDTQYVSSADDLATFSEGRSFGIDINWQNKN